MGERSGFFPYIPGDSNSEYNSDWLAKYIAAIISNGVYDGELGVTADGSAMSVMLHAGRAWINGYHYRNDGPLTLAIGNADGVLNRKDIVVLRWDVNARNITAKVLKGTPASTATAPAIVRTVEQYDLKIAEISIPAGTTAITQALITDTRLDKSVCGIVTGVVQQLDFADYTTQLRESFETWFEKMKGQLSEDAAGHLQLEIDKKIGEPTSEGSSGQALLTDGAGGRSWGTVGNKIYTGATEPSSSAGANGDFYFKTK